jgi:hypothetical protein
MPNFNQFVPLPGKRVPNWCEIIPPIRGPGMMKFSNPTD